MSYILDALRKSEQQRRQGDTPAAHLTPSAEVAPVPVTRVGLILLALALLLIGSAGGFLLGGWQPWRDKPAPAQEAAAPERTAAWAPDSLDLPNSSDSRLAATSPAIDVAETSPLLAAPAPEALPVTPTPPMPVPAPTPAPSVSEPAPSRPASVTPTPTPRPTAPTVVVAPAPPPPELEREIPPIRIAMHGYTPVARDRLVMIDGALLREGEAVAPGLRLEEITPDGVVLGYKGYRFHRSVR
jgi:general secretion pathway protein B